MDIIFVLGPPGAGKGTHCKRLQSQSTGICHISVGDFLREIQQNGLPAGQESIAEALRTGIPMPGGVLADLLSQRLVEEEKHGATVALIDGFPRSVDQAEEFKVTRWTPRGVIQLVCDREIALSRCVGRHESTRPDEDEKRFNWRYDNYEATLGPLYEKYSSQWEEVDCSGEVDTVSRKFREAVQRQLSSDLRST